MSMPNHLNQINFTRSQTKHQKLNFRHIATPISCSIGIGEGQKTTANVKDTITTYSKRHIYF